MDAFLDADNGQTAEIFAVIMQLLQYLPPFVSYERVIIYAYFLRIFYDTEGEYICYPKSIHWTCFL